MPTTTECYFHKGCSGLRFFRGRAFFSQFVRLCLGVDMIARTAIRRGGVVDGGDNFLKHLIMAVCHTRLFFLFAVHPGPQSSVRLLSLLPSFLPSSAWGACPPFESRESPKAVPSLEFRTLYDRPKAGFHFQVNGCTACRESAQQYHAFVFHDRPER